MVSKDVKILITELLHEKEWDEVYEMFPTQNGQELSVQTLVEYIQDNFSVHETGAGNIGVALGENEINVKSEYAIVSRSDENYILELMEDSLEFSIPLNFDEFSTVQFKSMDSPYFQCLSVGSDAQVIATMKLVLFRSALNMYLYDAKDRGYL